jgi:hypothetical protein
MHKSIDWQNLISFHGDNTWKMGIEGMCLSAINAVYDKPTPNIIYNDEK